jgi:hypothetical protein
MAQARGDERLSAEVAYCWPAGDMDVSNQLANGMMQFSLNVQGIVS